MIFILSKPNTAACARWTICAGAVGSRGQVGGCGTQILSLFMSYLWVTLKLWAMLCARDAGSDGAAASWQLISAASG